MATWGQGRMQPFQARPRTVVAGPDMRRPPSRTGTPPLSSFMPAENLIIDFDDDEDAVPLPAQPGTAITSQRAPSGPLRPAQLPAGPFHAPAKPAAPAAPTIPSAPTALPGPSSRALKGTATVASTLSEAEQLRAKIAAMQAVIDRQQRQQQQPVAAPPTAAATSAAAGMRPPSRSAGFRPPPAPPARTSALSAGASSAGLAVGKALPGQALQASRSARAAGRAKAGGLQQKTDQGIKDSASESPNSRLNAHKELQARLARAKLLQEERRRRQEAATAAKEREAEIRRHLQRLTEEPPGLSSAPEMILLQPQQMSLLQDAPSSHGVLAAPSVVAAGPQAASVDHEAAEMDIDVDQPNGTAGDAMDTIQLHDPEIEKQLQQLLEGSRAAEHGADAAMRDELDEEEEEEPGARRQGSSPISPAGSRALLKSQLWEQQARKRQERAGAPVTGQELALVDDEMTGQDDELEIMSAEEGERQRAQLADRFLAVQAGKAAIKAQRKAMDEMFQAMKRTYSELNSEQAELESALGSITARSLRSQPPPPAAMLSAMRSLPGLGLLTGPLELAESAEDRQAELDARAAARSEQLLQQLRQLEDPGRPSAAAALPATSADLMPQLGKRKRTEAQLQEEPSAQLNAAAVEPADGLHRSLVTSTSQGRARHSDRATDKERERNSVRQRSAGRSRTPVKSATTSRSRRHSPSPSAAARNRSPSHDRRHPRGAARGDFRRRPSVSPTIRRRVDSRDREKATRKRARSRSHSSQKPAEKDTQQEHNHGMAPGRRSGGVRASTRRSPSRSPVDAKADRKATGPDAPATSKPSASPGAGQSLPAHSNKRGGTSRAGSAAPVHHDRRSSSVPQGAHSQGNQPSASAKQANTATPPAEAHLESKLPAAKAPRQARANTPSSQRDRTDVGVTRGATSPAGATSTAPHAAETGLPDQAASPAPAAKPRGSSSQRAQPDPERSQQPHKGRDISGGPAQDSRRSALDAQARPSAQPSHETSAAHNVDDRHSRDLGKGSGAVVVGDKAPAGRPGTSSNPSMAAGRDAEAAALPARTNVAAGGDSAVGDKAPVTGLSTSSRPQSAAPPLLSRDVPEPSPMESGQLQPESQTATPHTLPKLEPSVPGTSSGIPCVSFPDTLPPLPPGSKNGSLSQDLGASVAGQMQPFPPGFPPVPSSSPPFSRPTRMEGVVTSPSLLVTKLESPANKHQSGRTQENQASASNLVAGKGKKTWLGSRGQAAPGRMQIVISSNPQQDAASDAPAFPAPAFLGLHRHLGSMSSADVSSMLEVWPVSNSKGQAAKTWTPDSTYVSPLSRFRSYRLCESYRAATGAPFLSATYGNNIDAQWPLCPYEARGSCRNAKCPYQMTSDYTLEAVHVVRDIFITAQRAGSQAAVPSKADAQKAGSPENLADQLVQQAPRQISLSAGSQRASRGPAKPRQDK
ncbi:hypothetical protein WJX84_006524 [Apatococcus fuscideae]|uniref:Uncharacterized protein n=1 Tax=Apatococcus fuscideae TaxID=2026836 RepID=A0AAW1S9M0_9CHLO